MDVILVIEYICGPEGNELFTSLWLFPVFGPENVAFGPESFWLFSTITGASEKTEFAAYKDYMYAKNSVGSVLIGFSLVWHHSLPFECL